MSAPAVVHCVSVRTLQVDDADPTGRLLMRDGPRLTRWFAAADRTRFEEVAAEVRAGALADRAEIASLTIEQVQALPLKHRAAAEAYL